MVKFQPGQGICRSVGGAFDVPDVAGELGNEVQVSHLPAGLLSGALGEAKARGLWSVAMWKLPTSNKMLKVPGCCVDCQELVIKSAIVLFSWGQLPGEVPYSL